MFDFELLKILWLSWQLLGNISKNPQKMCEFIMQLGAKYKVQKLVAKMFENRC